MGKLLSVSAVPVLVVALLTTGFNSQNLKAETPKVTNQTSQNTTPTLLAQRTLRRSFLTSRKWRFGRDNGTTIANSIRLNEDGTITGYYNQNEDHWDIEGMELVFYNPNNEPTTRFGTFRKDGNRWVLIGVLPTGDPSNPRIVLVLTEIK